MLIKPSTMIGGTYETIPSEDKMSFYFVSEGKKGEIVKVVVFQFLYANNYNLAFGDLKSDTSIDDKIVSNNDDATKVLSTVVKCVYDFLEKHSEAIIHITPVDSKRKSLYNYVFQKRKEEIEGRFVILAKINDRTELFDTNKMYDKFILHQKNSGI